VKTVYLADDDEDDRMLIRDAIERVICDVEVIEVEDGEKLLSLITAHGSWHHPVMILMDMNMPRKNGLETLAFLRSMPEYQHIPVLMMSTTTNHQMIDQANELGLNECLIKPINEDEFTRFAEAVDASFEDVTPFNAHNPKSHLAKEWNPVKWNHGFKHLPNFPWETASYFKKR
jgi:CheY-like chemotaxis protein